MIAFCNQEKAAYAEVPFSNASAEGPVPIDTIIESVIEELRELRNKTTALFEDCPVGLVNMFDHLEKARQIHRRAVNKVRQHYQDEEEGLFLRHVRRIETFRARHTWYISFSVHLWVYNLMTGFDLRKAVMLQQRDSRLARLDDALDKVINPQAPALIDEGNVSYL
jgi:hypothetical protein